ncbi:esterase/lipase family protein [Hymenobacter gummosus]|uniref:esterase/lipase family protein n=1 Tax=Hymenobacter gummosus TaxID=1776032 RepID=UPI001A9D900A|nr:alpha/beta hydrolase [Hymenobacter gummosus]
MAASPLVPSSDDSTAPRPSRWRRAAGTLRRAVTAPFTGLEALLQTGRSYRHFLLPALNGAIGDQLAARGDQRAIRLSFRLRDADVPAIDLNLSDGPRPTVVFLHGLMGDEHIWQTGPAGLLRYGPRLAEDLGVRCLYVRYNTGLHISENGRALHQLLTQLLQAWPDAITDLTLVGHSMGGLVIRSAGYYASEEERMRTEEAAQDAKAEPAGAAWLPDTASAPPASASPDAAGAENQPAPPSPLIPPASPTWLAHLRQVFLLGVPNEGSFLEQNSFLTALALRRFDLRLARLLADTIDRRSHGIRDLRHARLVDEDWQNPHADDLLPPRTNVPPLPGVQYHVLAASLLKNAESALAQYFGDGLVGGGSATGSVFRRAQQVAVQVFPRQHHGTLLADADVYEYIRARLV